MSATQNCYVTPRVNVVEHADAIVIEAELPGITREQADIEVRDGTLHLKAHRDGNGGSGGAYRLRERPGVDYYRAFELGDAIDPAKIEARLKDGLLTLTLMKSEKIKPRSVAVN